MNAVLYTHELEPITVVNINMSLWQRLYNGERISLAVYDEPILYPSDGNNTQIKFRKVDILAEKLIYRGNTSLMLFTCDEENALALKASFLPGQHSEVQRRTRNAFADGFLAAIGSSL